jgi:hypothetical protein
MAEAPARLDPGHRFCITYPRLAPDVPEWRTRRFFRLPSLEVAAQLATEVGTWAKGLCGHISTPTAIASHLGWKVRRARLAADIGGQDALLIPSSRREFTIVVDPCLSSHEAHLLDGTDPALCEAIIEFRIGHEIGHSFFYDDDLPPSRLLPFSAEEEAFCDAFAISLIAPGAAQRGARSSLDLIRTLGAQPV